MGRTTSRRPSHHPATLLSLDTPASVEAAALLGDAVQAAPRAAQRAIAAAERLGGAEPVARVLVHRAAAVAANQGGSPRTALAHAEQACETAANWGEPVAISESERTRALCLVAAGRGDEAVEAATRAVDAVADHPHAEARARAQRGLITQRLARTDWEADLDAALAALQAVGDDHWIATISLNRGHAFVYASRLDEARADLERAAALQHRLGNDRAAAFATHNLGFALSRAGDLARALATYDEAERVLVDLDVDYSPAVIDRAETLLAAGLVHESAHRLRAQMDAMASHQPALLPEALILLARVLLVIGDLDAAAEAADRAARLLAAQDRPGWLLLARGTRALAMVARGTMPPQQAAEIADEATAGAWPDVGTELRAAAALRASQLGDDTMARGLLGPLEHVVDELPMTARLAVVRASIAVAEASGDHARVIAHADRARRWLEDRRVLLGASELQARISGLANDILTSAALAGLERQDLTAALQWVDRVRSQALDHPPVVPPDDAELAADLGRLRVLGAELSRRQAAGQQVAELATDRDALERRVQERARTASGIRHALVERPRTPGVTEVAYLDLGTQLAALVATDEGVRRVDLAIDGATVGRELDALRFAMRRVVATRAPGRRRDMAARSLQRSLDATDRALVDPLGVPPDSTVVVSPTSGLHDVPWSGLPSLTGCALSVAPSLRLSRRSREATNIGTLLLEGPRLAHARAEIDMLSTVVGAPALLTGDDATVAAARELLPDVAVAHLACHGVFRADNPQFSSLELADGPMFVYDLESLPRVPPLIVLSSCQSARSSVQAGDELLGVTASLLAMGALDVVAAVADVPDDLTATLMVAFHHAIANGAGPAAALARARTVLLAGAYDPAATLTAAAFTCFGAP